MAAKASMIRCTAKLATAAPRGVMGPGPIGSDWSVRIQRAHSGQHRRLATYRHSVTRTRSGTVMLAWQLRPTAQLTMH
jgi:hypothetical protein